MAREFKPRDGKWKRTQLSTVLRRVIESIEPNATEMYREIGVKSHGRGIFHKGPITGESLGNKRVYRVLPDCFVFNVVFAWEQAVAKTSSRESGMIASHRFPMYQAIDNKIDLDFLLLFFKTPLGKHQLGLASPGGAGRNRTLSQSGFLKIEIPLPPIEQQVRIAKAIQRWDHAILLLEKQLRFKRLRLRALMQQLLTGEIRLPKFGAKPKSRPSAVQVPAAVRQGIYPPSVQPGIPRLMECPDGWTKVTMAELLRVEKRPVTLDDNKEYQLVVAKRNRGGIEPRDRLRGSEIKTPTQFEVRAGDFVISRRQIIHGACGVVPASLDGAIVSNEYSVCTVNANLDMTFLKYLTHTLYFQQTCFHSSVGVALEKMIFKLEHWQRFPFLVPPIAEQRAIGEVLSATDSELNVLVQQISLLTQQRDGLMYQLLNGTARFNVDAKTAKR
ncbi:MAG: restriction endonuclease subunit S [Bacteroidota bacterium]